MVIDGSKTVLATGETVYIPKGSSFSIRIASRFARAYVFANGGGLIELLSALGEAYEHSIPPEKEQKTASEKLVEAAAGFDCTVQA